MDKLTASLPEALDDVDRMLERNFQSDVFVAPTVIDTETQKRLEAVSQL